jgi:uncharacterized protein YbjT (DUF2867 family)
VNASELLPQNPRVLVAGATGFVGRALVPALLQRGHHVRACARRAVAAPRRDKLEFFACDLLDEAALPPLLAGIDVAYYLVHSLGGEHFRDKDRRAASTFAGAAARAGLGRIVYLGGVAPRGHASEHLASRLEVGEILRSGRVPALELRAGMIVGPGSASWQIVRDLALRLPAMVLPAWLDSRIRPIALDDVVEALVDALALPLARSAHYDIAGPDTLSCRQVLERIAALEGRRLPALSLPWLTPKLSAHWLRLVTRANYALARELVLGLTEDLLPENDRYADLTRHRPAIGFDDAARAAIAAGGRSGALGTWHEALVRRMGPRL